MWRGVNRVEDALGLAWTTDRDVACWFAMRFFERYQTAFVFTCLLSPDNIVTECNGRSEHEVIPELRGLPDRVFLDVVKHESRIGLDEVRSESDVPRSALANWRERYNRVAALREAEIQKRLSAARRRKMTLQSDSSPNT